MEKQNKKTTQPKINQFFKPQSKKKEIEEEKMVIDESNASQKDKQDDCSDELRQTGYEFAGRSLKLQKISDKTPFQFTNQAEYDYLNALIARYIQQSMVVKYKMNEVWIPENEDGPKCNIFLSSNFYDQSATKCLIIIQGTGEVRAGQWSRRVCTKEGLRMGSMLPQIDWAETNGLSYIVFNPNMRSDCNGDPINHCESMSDHCLYVWDQYITQFLKQPKKSLFILAHSAGGRCVAELFANNTKQFLTQVKAMVFTDAFYHGMFGYMNAKEKEWARNVGIHYKIYTRNQKPLGQPFSNQNGPIKEVSAGTDKHELSTGKSCSEFLKFLDAKLKKL